MTGQSRLNFDLALLYLFPSPGGKSVFLSLGSKAPAMQASDWGRIKPRTPDE